MMNWKEQAAAEIRTTSGAPLLNPDRAVADALEAALEAGEVPARSVEFATSLVRGYRKYHGWTERQRPYALRLAEEVTRPRPTDSPVANVLLGVDLRPVPAGMYAVENRRYRIDKPEIGKWAGYVFIKGGTGRRIAMVRPDERAHVAAQPARGDIEAIAADPRAASKRYGAITGSCGVCGRTLENPESVAAGIGPICAERLGW